jgi:parallel beta-helix repeat protein
LTGILLFQKHLPMKIKLLCAIAGLLASLKSTAQPKYGADIPWTTYEAEAMYTTGKVLGPKYTPFQVETESSGQKCVKLGAAGQFIEFTSKGMANSLVLRYSLPDKKQGNGLLANLGIYVNGKVVRHEQISSRYSWLYGKYPFTNDPAGGHPRNFYNEIRIKDLHIGAGDKVRAAYSPAKDDGADYCIIDLVDLENISPALKQPENALSVTNPDFTGKGIVDDYTEAFRRCITKAAETGKTVWIPAGNFKISGDITLPAGLHMQGAGMWYTTLVGDNKLYGSAERRVRLKGDGSNIHISDFAITGKLTYRSDKEGNDGIVGSFGTNSSISRIWIEHTKVGMWIENSQNLKITGCRMRNTIADGINLCVGMSKSTIQNCTARGTGDDCFAIWPAAFAPQTFSPGHNLITNCTAQLPFLANGAAIYGGESNNVKNCLFKDISQGSAILISTTFPTANPEKGVDNNFSGTTVADNCEIATSGGFDHEWDWRAALEICVDKRAIKGVQISNLHITNSLSNAINVIAGKSPAKPLSFTDAVFENVDIHNYGLGKNKTYGLYVAKNANGSLQLRNSSITRIKIASKSFTMLNK